MSLSNQHTHVTQPPSGDNSLPETGILEHDRAANMSMDYDSGVSGISSSRSQFVPNPIGMGPRSVPKRSTFIRTRHFDTSNDELTHDQQQPTYEYDQTSSYLAAPQLVRHSSNARSRLVHGALDSRDSSGHDSGLSSGGVSFDPEQHHHLYNLGNASHFSPSYHTMRSGTPTVDAYDVPPPVPIPKRKSLPSIVKALPKDYKIDETARSSDKLPEKETFIIENGIRKRVTAQPPTYTDSGSLIPQASVMTSSSGSPVLVRRVLLESVNRIDQPSSTSSAATSGGNKRVSMPTLVNIARHRQEAPSRRQCRVARSTNRCFLSRLGIPREEASRLGSRRREELRRQHDFDSTAIGRVKALLQVGSSFCCMPCINHCTVWAMPQPL